MASCWASSAGMIDLYLVHWLLSVFWARHRGIYLWRWTLFTACRCAAVQKAAPQCYLAEAVTAERETAAFQRPLSLPRTGEFRLPKPTFMRKLSSTSPGVKVQVK